MKLHEYQSKTIFSKYGIPIPKGRVAATAQEARQVAEELGGRVVIKSQVLVGGRGKAGGVKLAKDPAEAEQLAAQILGMEIKGLPVRKVLVDEASAIDQEIYFAITDDRSAKKPVMIASAAGGIDIEEVAAHTPEKIFKEYIASAKVNVFYSYRLKSVNKHNAVINEIVIESSGKPAAATDRIVRAKVFIDCSYQGDLLAGAGISYTVGRESNAEYGETFNGVQIRDKHQFPDGIDPYKIKGKAESGLLWGISNSSALPPGSGDKKVQAYNFRICLSGDPANQIAITRPGNYDPGKYELLLRVLEKEPGMPFDQIMKPDMMPNNKTDINNNGPLSTDMIGMNYEYPEGDYNKRAAIQKAHELYVKGLLYFIGHDPRMPKHLREEMLKWGYPKDEYTGNNNWSPQMYVREARRMVGAYTMTQANCQGKERVTDGVGMAAYTMDSHNCDRIVIEKNGVKMVKNEGDVQEGGFPPYPIAYRSLIPKEQECKNLLVPVCLSASHIAYGSIRMEPVFMVLAQSAAAAASMAIDHDESVQEIEVSKLQELVRLNPLADGSKPDIFIDNEDMEGVTLKGSWKKIIDSHNSYSSSWLQNDGDPSEQKSVTFTPGITKEGRYKVYTYVPKIQGASSSLVINIFNGKIIKEIFLDLENIEVKGQTSGEWVSLGEYNFPAGKNGFIEITNKKADGLIIADAVLLVPSKE
ncbi:MAG: FAD-dependent oxidoreductase [Ferruginibacter sp.]